MATWIKLSSGTSGSGAGTITFTVDPNGTGLPRSGTIAVEGRLLSIDQAAETATYTVTTVPAGRSIIVDGQTLLAPQTFVWTPGSQHTIAVPVPQISTGARYVFANWSDAGAVSHTVVAPNGGASYTATFTTQYLLTTSTDPATGGTIVRSPVSSDGYYDAGTSVQLTATATTGYVFSEWTGDLTGASNPGVVVMGTAKSIGARFSAAAAPAPTILSKTPASAPPGELTLRLDGYGFVAGAVIRVGNIPLTTTLNSYYRVTGTGVVLTPGVYSVTVTNPGSSFSNVVPFTILSPIVTVSPTPVTVLQKMTQQFTALVANTTNTGVVWKVNNVVGGSSTTGTITETGLYTAPAASALLKVTVSAASVADPTKSGAAAVTIQP